MRAYITRLRQLELELEQMRREVERMVPERPTLHDNMEAAYIFIAQAASGCQQARHYLERAVKEVLT